MSNSNLVNYILLSPNCNKPRNKKISKITIHHMAGNISVEKCGNIFKDSKRMASSNYGIDSEGRVGMYVEESNRAWTSSNALNDNEAVTIEVANCSSAPDWLVNTTAFNKLIDLCVDICKRNDIKELKWTGDASGNLTCHYMFASTACPGPFLKKRMPEIAMEVNKRLGVDDYATNDKKIWDFLKNKGFNSYSISGIMGNIKAESNLIPTNLQNSYEKTFGVTDDEYTNKVDSGEYDNFVNDKAGYGLCQWTFHTRKKALLDYCKSNNKSIGDLQSQLEFMCKELYSNKEIMNILNNAKTVKEASDCILTKFEKPADMSNKVKKKREEYSLEYFNKFSKQFSQLVKVISNNLNIRSGPGTNFKKVGSITDKGTYTIVEICSNWGKLKSGAGWICLDYTNK